MKLIIWVTLFIFIIGCLYIQFGKTKEGQITAGDVCPDPVYSTDPNSDIFDALLINDFMDYMENKLQKVSSDLDVMSTIVSGTTFNIIIDPDLIPDVSNNQTLPAPKITMDSTNPPNYGIILKLPKGRMGPKGEKGINGVTGPTGTTGPTGPDGNPGKRILLL